MWRKELSERVREVRERRAREAEAEARKAELAGSDHNPDNEVSVPQLELLSRPITASSNPLVEAALRRIDRANHPPQDAWPAPVAQAAVASAISRARDDRRTTSATEVFRVPQQTNVTKPSNVTESVKIAAPTVVETDPAPLETPIAPVESTPHLAVASPSSLKGSSDKRRRLIVGDPHDPALNYLDSIPTAVRVEAAGHTQAPAVLRLVAAIVDLVFVIFLTSPFAAAVELLYGTWEGPLGIAIPAVSFMVMTFLYGTISTALTGKTLGMKLLALRVIDARTGLIPTGSQSAGRALLYLASYLTLGGGIIYALIDREKRPAHDRFTRTAVVRSRESDAAAV